MPTIEKLSIALPTEMASVVRQAVDAGEYSSQSEVVRDALRDWTPSLARLPLLNSATRRKSSQLIAIKRSTTENAGSGVPSTCHAGPNPLIQPPMTSFMTAYTLCNLQFIRLSVSSLAASYRHVAPLRQ